MTNQFAHIGVFFLAGAMMCSGEQPEGNLLGNTRFPLGLQGGWMLNREISDGDDVKIFPDPAVVGPSGVSALRLERAQEAIEPSSLTSAPFTLEALDRKHTLGLSVRGSDSLEIMVFARGSPVAKQTFTISSPNDWKTVSITFSPKASVKEYSFKMTWKDALWIDALQVVPGERPREYATRMDCEVALASDSPNNIQFVGEQDPVIKYCVTGEAKDAVVKAKVVSLYGDEKPLPDTPIGGGFINRGTISFGVHPDKPYGSFRIETWVERGGNRISPYNEIVMHRVRKPRYWMKDAPNSPFGTHLYAATRTIQMAKAVGFNWVRCHDAGLPYTGWYHLEPRKGTWVFRDNDIHRFRTNGMKILGALSTAPKWATAFQHLKPHSGYSDRWYMPLSMEDYANYVRTIIEHYRGVIDAYEVWNEPYIATFLPSGYDETKGGKDGYLFSDAPERDYHNLLATAYHAAKSVDPNVTIVGIVTCTSGNMKPASYTPGGPLHIGGKDWSQRMAKLDAGKDCDVVSYHQYEKNIVPLCLPDDRVEKGFHTATDPFRAKDPSKRIWYTEGNGNGKAMKSGFFNYTVPGLQEKEDITKTSDMYVRFMAALLVAGAEKEFFYSMHCYGHFYREGQNEATLRFLVNEDGSLHPAGTACAAFTWLIEDKQFVKRIIIADKVSACLFEGGNSSTAVIVPDWSHPGAYTPSPDNGTMAFYDIYGNPWRANTPVDDVVLYASSKLSAAELAKALKP